MAESNLTPERLHELLDYNQETGLFTWKVRRGSAVKAGDIAGTNGTGGYIHVRIDGAPFMAHRLAWFYCFGVWPEKHIDHINGKVDDNRLSNLRQCTVAQNMQNMRHHKNSATKLTGAYPNQGSRLFKSIITVSGKAIYLGSFPTAELANKAYIAAKAQLHTFQPTIR